MKILAVMADLFFSVKINDAAKRVGLTAQFVKDADRALENARSSPALVIVDLNCASARPLDLIRAIKADPQTRSVPILGFVSHVQTDLRREAVEAGCDEVVPRSVFAQKLESLIEFHAVRPA